MLIASIILFGGTLLVKKACYSEYSLHSEFTKHH